MMDERHGMECPECGKKTRVYKTIDNPNTIERKRECTVCGHKFVTTEYVLKDEKKYSDDMVALFFPGRKH